MEAQFKPTNNLASSAIKLKQGSKDCSKLPSVQKASSESVTKSGQHFEPKTFRKTRSFHNFGLPAYDDHDGHHSDDGKSSTSGDFSNSAAGMSFMARHHKKDLTCGILGGLGPEATIHFMQLILTKTKELYGASKDQDHIHTVIEMNPKVPNRNHAIFGTGEDCGPVLSQMASNLSAAKVDFVVCACNTAHAFQEDMAKGCGDDVPFVSMIDVTSNHVLTSLRETNAEMRCGILGGGGCIEAKLYQNALSCRGIEPIIPSPKMQDLMQDIIYRVKAGDKESVVADFILVLNELVEQQCSSIILGCTELPIIIDSCLEAEPSLQKMNFVDTSAVMVETVVKLCRGDLDLDRLLMHFSNPEMEDILSEGEDEDFDQSTQHQSEDGDNCLTTFGKKIEMQAEEHKQDEKLTMVEYGATQATVVESEQVSPDSSEVV